MPISVVLNRYIKADNTGFHADDDPLFGGKYQSLHIISITLGGNREFTRRPRSNFRTEKAQ